MAKLSCFLKFLGRVSRYATQQHYSDCWTKSVSVCCCLGRNSREDLPCNWFYACHTSYKAFLLYAFLNKSRFTNYLIVLWKQQRKFSVKLHKITVHDKEKSEAWEMVKDYFNFLLRNLPGKNGRYNDECSKQRVLASSFEPFNTSQKRVSVFMVGLQITCHSTLKFRWQFIVSISAVTQGVNLSSSITSCHITEWHLQQLTDPCLIKHKHKGHQAETGARGRTLAFIWCFHLPCTLKRT
jgi:hypothetical protein